MTKGHPWQPSAETCRKYSWPAGELHLLFLKESWSDLYSHQGYIFGPTGDSPHARGWDSRWAGLPNLTPHRNHTSCDNCIGVASRVSTRDMLCFKNHCPPGSSELWLLSCIHSSFLVPPCPHASSNRGDCYHTQCCLVHSLTLYLYLVTRET